MRESIKWVLFTLVVVTGWSFGQPATEKPKSDKPTGGERPLEDLIAAALRHSPDLQVADAKVREAEAELRRTRLTTVQKVIDANSAVEAARAALVRADGSFKEFTKLIKAGALSQEDFRAAEAKYIAAKTAPAQAESALNALTGRLPAGVGNVGAAEVAPGPAAFPGNAAGNGAIGIAGNTGIGSGIGGGMLGNGIGNIGGFGGIQGAFGGGLQGAFGGGIQGVGGFQGALGGGIAVGMQPPRVPLAPMSDKLRTALNANIKIKPIAGIPLYDVVTSYRSAAGVPFLLHLGDKGKEPVNLSLEGDVQLGAVFQALEDVVPGLKCYVREYGILVTLDETQPEGAMPLIEFWQRKLATDKAK